MHPLLWFALVVLAIDAGPWLSERHARQQRKTYRKMADENRRLRERL